MMNKSPSRREISLISRHGLVEFLPVLNSIARKLESHRYEIAVFGRVSSGKSSLINRLLEIELLPIGTTPITAVPIHIVGGKEPRLRVTFMDRTVELRVEALPEFATEQGNPGNSKRVVGLEVAVLSKRLPESPVWENLLLPSFKGITSFAPFSSGTASQTFNDTLLL
jgi:hypothetical protein